MSFLRYRAELNGFTRCVSTLFYRRFSLPYVQMWLKMSRNCWQQNIHTGWCWLLLITLYPRGRLRFAECTMWLHFVTRKSDIQNEYIYVDHEYMYIYYSASWLTSQWHSLNAYCNYNILNILTPHPQPNRIFIVRFILLK